MATVWKVGSRWNEYGDPRFSIKEIFLEHNIFIVGGDKARKRVLNVKPKDIVALADGIRVVAVGKVESKATELSKYNLGDKIDNYHETIQTSFNEGWPMAVRTRFYRLNVNDQFSYNQGEFHKVADNSYKDKIIKLFDNYDNQFEINAETWCLDKLMENNYQIPVYQRPYSWKKEQIETFIEDIFNSYWGFNKDSLPEPMFIGTMQISSKANKYGFYEVTDGQQRLTTILILLQLLNKRYDRSDELISLNTTVNNGGQQKFLMQLLNCSLNELIEDSTNKYLQNAYYTNTLLTDILETNIDSCFESFSIDNFIHYLYNQIKFVVIKINAGLSKTLQIFDTINTAGLSLAGSDIFKLRMYEYLNNKNEENAFEKINEIYQIIESNNEELGKRESDINQILSLYQNKLIAKYDLPNTLHDYSPNRFFEELFDTKFGIKSYQHFSKADEVDLKVDEIKKLITIRYQWVNGYYKDKLLSSIYTTEDYCLSHQIGWSRYGRYWILRFLFADRFENAPEKLKIFMRLLTKFFITYSVLFDRTIYHVHSVMGRLMHEMYQETSTPDSVINFISEEIKKDTPYLGNNRNALENEFKKNIFYSAKKKNIICRLSAMFDEEYRDSNNLIFIESIINKIYIQKIDIEHIHAIADTSIEFDNLLQNCIGNLVILEYDLNRSIGKNPYSEKRMRYLEDSKIASVKKIAQDNEEWGIDQVTKRRDEQIKILTDYLLNV